MRPAALMLTAAVVLAGLGHFLSDQPRQTPEHHGPPPSPLVIGGAAPAAPDEATEHDRAVIPRRPTAARATAKRFLAAYLRWEIGDDSARTANALRVSADAQLLRLLASARGRPDPVGEVSRAQLSSLVAGTVGPQRAATVAAELTRGGRRTSLAMVVKRRQGRWQVTSIGR